MHVICFRCFAFVILHAPLGLVVTRQRYGLDGASLPNLQAAPGHREDWLPLKRLKYGGMKAEMASN